MNLWSRFSAMALAAVTGVIVWSSGCGSGDERYYCDNTGCYSCDGYGCRNVNPPSNSPCTGNTSCPSGSVCTDTGCVQTCSADSDFRSKSRVADHHGKTRRRGEPAGNWHIQNGRGTRYQTRDAPAVASTG